MDLVTYFGGKLQTLAMKISKDLVTLCFNFIFEENWFDCLYDGHKEDRIVSKLQHQTKEGKKSRHKKRNSGTSKYNQTWL
jgi:hypothetical protein